MNLSRTQPDSLAVQNIPLPLPADGPVSSNVLSLKCRRCLKTEREPNEFGSSPIVNEGEPKQV